MHENKEDEGGEVGVKRAGPKYTGKKVGTLAFWLRPRQFTINQCQKPARHREINVAAE